MNPESVTFQLKRRSDKVSFSRSVACATILVVLASTVYGGTDGETSHAHPADAFTYLPEAWASRVVFYHSFENGVANPEINLLDAELSGFEKAYLHPRGKIVDTTHSGALTGNGYKTKTGAGFTVESPRLFGSGPITIMRWFRLDMPMTPKPGELDRLNLASGHPQTLDEIVIVDRALSAAEIKDYVRMVRQLTAIGLPYRE